MSPSGGSFNSSSFFVSSSVCLIILFIILTELTHSIDSLHVKGRWNSSEQFLKVVARFAVQRTDSENVDETRGYAYGNVFSSLSNSSQTKVMLFVNGSLFRQINRIYNEHFFQNIDNISNENIQKNLFCLNVQNHIERDHYSVHNKSHNFYYPAFNNARLNSVYYVPCSQYDSCQNPYLNQSSWPYQYTYYVDTHNESSFWYLILLSCQSEALKNHSDNNMHFKWSASSSSIEIIYDLWFVNGHPSKLSNFFIDFDHQFSFEQQNLIFYYVWLLCFFVLLILQLCALLLKNSQNYRNSNYLFTICLSLHCLAYLFYCIHKTIFSFDGKGLEILHISADVIKLLSTSLFMLFVLIMAKGWPINPQNLYSKSMLFFLWMLYTSIKFLLFIWIKSSIDFIEEIDEHHTLPGWISMSFRIFFMLWFIRELRHTMTLEQNTRKLRFYLCFGAGMLVWFFHLPFVACVAMQIEIMSRYKIISGFSSFADVFAYGVVTRSMWQISNKSFLNTDVDPNDDNEPQGFYDSFRRESLNINRACQKSQYEIPNSCDTSPFA